MREIHATCGGSKCPCRRASTWTPRRCSASARTCSSTTTASTAARSVVWTGPTVCTPLVRSYLRSRRSLRVKDGQLGVKLSSSSGRTSSTVSRSSLAQSPFGVSSSRATPFVYRPHLGTFRASLKWALPTNLDNLAKEARADLSMCVSIYFVYILSAIPIFVDTFARKKFQFVWLRIH